MPYQTGTATDFTDLKNEIFAFLTANGWTQENDIIKRNGVFAKLDVVSASWDWLRLTGGKGSDGAGNLVFPQASYDDYSVQGAGSQNINDTLATGSLSGMVFPITYHFHLASTPVDEFWCIVEYNGDLFQHMGFGNVLKSTSYTGGGFYSASLSGQEQQNSILTAVGSNIYGSMWYGEFWPFQRMHINASARAAPSTVHAEVGGRDWHQSTYMGNRDTMNSYEMVKEMKASESSVNGMPNLIPFRLWVITNPVTDKTYQNLGVLNNIRFCEIANINPGQIESDGTDSWKFYPCLRKDTDHPEGWYDPASSGIGGLAIRYDGP